MYSFSKVEGLIDGWKAEGLSKKEIVVRAAEACMGWPYVWGALGQKCTVSVRQQLMDRSAIAEGDRELIRKRCQVLNGSRADCGGCKYYPGNERTLVFDCRGFTRWIFGRVGILIDGAGATSQWNNEKNWSEKGLIADMPEGAVCCVFKQVGGKTMDHTGICVGGGRIIHCSVEVKEGKTTDRGWTHYAIPKGIDENPQPEPEPQPEEYPTIRYGSRGMYVRIAQEQLKERGYDIGSSGVDGIFGARTQEAVKQFQKRHGLAADGIIGKKTWKELIESDGGDEEKKTYTVTIRGLGKEAADKLKKEYPACEITEERSE